MQQSWRQDNDKLTFIACLPPAVTSANPTSSDDNSCRDRGQGQSRDQGSVKARQDDTPERMIGDINLFLTPYDASEDWEEDVVLDPEPQAQQAESSVAEEDKEMSGVMAMVGEIELMIAPPQHRQKGRGRAALRAFLYYISAHLEAILAEYCSGCSPNMHDPTTGSDVDAEKGEGEGKGQSKAELKYLRVKINKDNVGSIALFQKAGFVMTGAGANYFGEVELRLEDFGQLEEVKKTDDVVVARYECLV